MRLAFTDNVFAQREHKDSIKGWRELSDCGL
jgi:hypothetical protein